jgi:hypothetical protein
MMVCFLTVLDHFLRKWRQERVNSVIFRCFLELKAKGFLLIELMLRQVKGSGTAPPSHLHDYKAGRK